MKTINKIFILLFVSFLFNFNVNIFATSKTENGIIEVTSISQADIVSKNMESGTEKYYAITDNNHTDNYSSVTNSYIPNSVNILSTNISITSIIGDDNRTKVNDTTIFPYSAILYIEISFPDGYNAIGTAFMYGPDEAITAGHCVYSKEHGGFAKSITVWPGKHGFGLWNNPYGTAKSTSLHTSVQWSTNEDTNYDWGVIELDSSIGNKCGYMSITSTSSNLAGTNAIITGYPGEYKYYQYTSRGNINSSNDYLLFYSIDTTSGQSGSPIYYSSNNIVFGIHTTGHGGNSDNHGTRITQKLYDFCVNIKNG